MENNKTQLCGIKAICCACRNLELPSSEASVMAMIIYESLPARKLGGVWISDTDLIIKWRHEQIMTRPEVDLQMREEKNSGSYIPPGLTIGAVSSAKTVKKINSKRVR